MLAWFLYLGLSCKGHAANSKLRHLRRSKVLGNHAEEAIRRVPVSSEENNITTTEKV